MQEEVPIKHSLFKVAGGAALDGQQMWKSALTYALRNSAAQPTTL